MPQNRSGVLLVNIGTPEAPTKEAIKKYLKQFLSDQRIVDVPRWIWWPLLHLIILPTRSRRLVQLYISIWMNEGSPLMVYSQRQCYKLSTKLDIPVALGMNYGNPSLKSALDILIKKQKIKKLIVLPLFPQFSCATAGAVWDGIHKVFSDYRSIPSVCFIRDYAQNPTYIAALAASVNYSFKKYGKPDLLIVSFHGVPQRFVYEGDDYPQRCYATFKLLIKALSMNLNTAMLTFQSRFGHEPWLTPYTQSTLEILPNKGIKNVHVISPGFSADCLETLEEINIQNREVFFRAGGTHFEYIRALNADEAHINMMKELVIPFCND
ncbi:ferrochelatase [Candidatus Erwinia haradaeae]|uniref:Ferrochelatase n=1 Tax=Candidatus Erwinia haradaeae TaxID=1922217 RepID=A0A451DH60_9GAMM|nr:ferrochelatase [Candidatus Erwinia haradaeae]VFP85955.1 Ferrochelatase [Candidatus Erwinia haradaeae]